MSDPFSSPIVYVGSTLAADEVRALLPGAIVRPPARRLDLYRDRAFGASTFVIIDGVFFQQLAISPREVLDVLADGARVVGASSMGALRAAECWPGGMVGKGTIFRAFKRGLLDSDDEVAVSFHPDRPRQSSVALVNVRYAARSAMRARLLSPSEAEALVRAARGLFFADRYWPRLLADAGLHLDVGTIAKLSGWDLKREDALRCLSYVAELEALPSSPRVIVPRALTRERDADPLAYFPRDAPAKLAEWLLLSGRYRELLPRRVAAPELLEGPPAPELASALWQALEQRGQLLNELFRYRAFLEGARRAPGGQVEPAALQATRAALAREHGIGEAWQELVAALSPRARRRLVTFSTRLAAAQHAAIASTSRGATQPGFEEGDGGPA